MKGGSMTAILLDTIFMTALSRVFSVSIHKLISSDKPEDGLENIVAPSRETLAVTDEFTILPSNGPSMDKAVHSISPSRLEVATIVDAFAATYNAAYRSALLLVFSFVYSLSPFLSDDRYLLCVDRVGKDRRTKKWCRLVFGYL